MYLNRTLCDVLEEMRKAHETRNYSYMGGLIEEAQSMGNRMESAIYYKNDIERYRMQAKEELAKLKKLEEKVKETRERSRTVTNTGTS